MTIQRDKTPNLENITFWKPPFRLSCGYVYDSAGDFCFQFTFKTGDYDKDEEIQQKIIDILNDKIDKRITSKLEIVDGYKIYAWDNPFIMVRGWGHLTGLSALHLDHDVAKKIQDDFAMWILNKLTKR